jgi:hypothetical protein
MNFSRSRGIDRPELSFVPAMALGWDFNDFAGDSVGPEFSLSESLLLILSAVRFVLVEESGVK